MPSASSVVSIVDRPAQRLSQLLQGHLGVVGIPSLEQPGAQNRCVSAPHGSLWLHSTPGLKSWGPSCGPCCSVVQRPLLFLWHRGGLESSRMVFRGLLRNLGARRSSLWASVKVHVSSFSHCANSGSLCTEKHAGIGTCLPICNSIYKSVWSLKEDTSCLSALKPCFYLQVPWSVVKNLVSSGLSQCIPCILSTALI